MNGTSTAGTSATGTVTRDAPGIRPADVLLVAFLGTVVMLFAGFTAAYLIRRAGSDWQPIDLPPAVWPGTLMLLASSATLEAATRGWRGRWLQASTLLGLGFLVGQVLAWRQLAAAGIYLPSNPHGAFFFMLTAVHGLHLVGGIGALLRLAVRGTRSRAVANYWHFVGLVWLYVLALLAL